MHCKEYESVREDITLREREIVPTVTIPPRISKIPSLMNDKNTE